MCGEGIRSEGRKSVLIRNLECGRARDNEVQHNICTDGVMFIPKLSRHIRHRVAFLAAFVRNFNVYCVNCPLSEIVIFLIV